AANADGTGLTHLSDDVVQAFAGQDAASPVAARVAYTALTDDGGLVLRQVRLPNGPAITAASLVPPGYEPPASRAEDETRWQAYEVSRSKPPRWAPDGDHLAYVGLAEGPDADVYLYSLFTGVSVRLSDEPGHAIEPQWAPDGRFIVYGVRHDPNAGSTVLVDEVWVAWTNGTGDKPLYTPSGAGERLFGWLEYDTVLVASSARSEEHTSELQSRENLVCRLLLERCGHHRDLHSVPTRRSSDRGRFIVYGVRHDPNAGSTVLVDEVWVAWTNGTGDKPLYTPSGAGERLFGWLEYDTVLVASSA